MEHKNTILIVDDNPSIRTFLKVPLQSKFNIIQAASAEEAIDMYMKKGPELVILDLGLPDKDGFHVLEEVRKKDDTTKVIILTARDDNESREKSKKLGANEYMTKPFRFSEILDVIEGQLSAPS